MRRRLLLSYLSITCFVLVALALPLGLSYRQGQERQLSNRVQDDAFALAVRVDVPLAQGDTTTLRRVVHQLAHSTGDSVVVVDSDGRVLVTAGGHEPAVGTVTRTADLTSAQRSHPVTGHRNIGGDALAVSVPVLSSGGAIGALRMSASLAVVDHAVTRNWLILGGLAGIIALIVLLVSTLLARSFTKPLADLDAGAARLGDGDLAVRVAVPSDPPELRRLALSFNTTAARLESLLSSQRAFVADASHQLRTPLAALRLRLENVEADGPDHRPEDLDGALAEVRRLTALVESLLVLARAEDAPAPSVAVSLAPLVEARLDAWSAVADERGVRLDASVHHATVRSDPGRLDQVLDNLLSNALDVAPRGTAVQVAARPMGARVELEVRDHGPGMTPEQRARAFDRFWRSSGSRRTDGGFGLGLPIVRRLVVADGGEVRLEDAPGGGLAVVVSLPAIWPSLRASA
ncbi:MAG TPA: HAMP domain-containing sensor histidine kinase [Acidimicrobiia bacterium]|nr:HAMP domain-containing sensor histidine kinase [Acidimicrobiia bacterium]